MARQPRFVLPGHPQHIIQRGNNRQAIFHTESDYQYYLEKLHNTAQINGCDIHAYILMTNHVHLLVTPHTDNSISKMMQSLGRYYVQHFNYTYKRTGTLWEGRYKASLIDSERYLLICMKYIELNPVRMQGAINQPADYPWSSYHHNALGVADKLISEHITYLGMGKTPESRQLAYQALFKTALPNKTLNRIRDATNKAWVLGENTFITKVQQLTGRIVTPTKRGGDRRSSNFLAKFNRTQPR